MKTNRGEITVGVIVLIAAISLIGGFFIHKKTAGDTAAPTAAGQAVLNNQNQQNKVDEKIAAEKLAQGKTAQQYIEAQGVALNQLKSDEPAAQFLKEINPRASLALSNSLGPLDVEQQRWATQLAFNYLSEEMEKRLSAEKALEAKDKQLQGSIVNVKSLNAETTQLKAENKVLTDKLVAESASAVAFRNKIYFIVGSVLFIVIGLPILSAAFPVLGGVTNGLGAIISPFLHKAKKEAEGLAHDAVGVIHELGEKAKQGTITKEDFDAIKAGWISEAHKNSHAFNEARRKLNLI